MLAESMTLLTGLSEDQLLMVGLGHGDKGGR